MDDNSTKSGIDSGVAQITPTVDALPAQESQAKIEEKPQELQKPDALAGVTPEKPKTVPVIPLFAHKEEKMYVDQRLAKVTKSWGTSFAPLAPGSRGKMATGSNLSQRLNAMKRPAISPIRTPRPR